MLEIVHFTPVCFERDRIQADAWLLPLLRESTQHFQTIGVHGISNDWLGQQPWKRVLAFQVFHDLLEPASPQRRILEVGGGLSAITERLAIQHDYSLIELATHEKEENYRKLEASLGRTFVTLADWSDTPFTAPRDLVIANDLFPNVDQRLYAFIDAAWPMCRELRLTLTYYENTVWHVKRIPSGEQLIVRPWGLREVRVFLDHLVECHPHDFPSYDRTQLVYHDYEKILFTNRRNILRVRMTKQT
ncbi:MAG: class I SAM-dependent methyltransferase [Planctomycetes bacterium]|nr:class I SAM-dependent methyltransferase [Planctomycetota bacterium]